MNTRDDLSALLDNELDDAELAALEQELDGDDGLRADLEELRGVAEGLRGLGDVKAPEGFLAAVMGRIEAGEGLGDSDADADIIPLVPKAPTAAPTLAPAAEALPDNVVRMSWYIKGPMLAAVAALLLVGVGIGMRDQGPDAPPAASELVVRAPGSTAPLPTGTVAASDLEDAIAGVEVEDDEEAEVSSATAERIRMTPSDENRVAVGGAGTGPAAPAAPHTSGIREVPAASPPPGVVAVAEDYAPEMADGDAVASIEEMEPDMDEAAEPGLIPARAEAGALSMSPSEGRAKAARVRDDSPSGAMSAVASLRTSDRAAVSALRDAAKARGWTLNFVSPSEVAVALSDVQPEQVVELSLPPGQEIAAQRMLDRLGAFKFASTPEQSTGAKSMLRITVIYAP